MSKLSERQIMLSCSSYVWTKKLWTKKKKCNEQGVGGKDLTEGDETQTKNKGREGEKG